MYAIEDTIYITLIIAAFVLAVVIIIFISTMIRRHRKEVLSFKDKIIAESIITENERARIAADLHDEMGASFSAIQLYFQLLKPRNRADQADIERMAALVNAAIERVREISYNLSPQTLHKHGLLIAVEEFCAVITRSRQLQVRYQCRQRDIIISKDKEIHLYRIIQEIVTNAVKHGQPDQIVVSIATREKELLIDIKDDGNGFDPDHLPTNHGSGLQNIQSRVDLLQGILGLHTAPGSGAHYIITIPLQSI